MSKKNRNKIITALIVAALSAFGFINKSPKKEAQADTHTYTTQQTDSQSDVERAYSAKRSDVQVQGSGVVIKNLRDDNEGHRHQKFILRLASGNTILVAHNIDLAPKITSLQKGDTVLFNGEYEYDSRGGVVHWTHHDPQNHHINGWLKHNGKTYQ
jgi:hypothetical protein